MGGVCKFCMKPTRAIKEILKSLKSLVAVSHRHWSVWKSLQFKASFLDLRKCAKVRESFVRAASPVIPVIVPV